MSQVEDKCWASNTQAHVTKNLRTPSLNLCVHQAYLATGLVNCTVFRQRYATASVDASEAEAQLLPWRQWDDFPRSPCRSACHCERVGRHTCWPATSSTIHSLALVRPATLSPTLEVARGRVFNQDAWEKARAHHVAIQKLACFDEPCAALAKRVDFSASYNHDSIIFGNAHALLNTLLFLARSTAPDFSINHTFIAGVLHFLPCVGTPTEPAPPCNLRAWRRCHELVEMSNGQVGAVLGVETTC